MLVTDFGIGIFKPNIAPTIIDQYRHQKPYTQVLNNGEKVIIDPEASIQRIMLIFYGMVNVGAFYALATTYSEKYVGYWLAFLLAGLVYFMLPILLAVMYKRTYRTAPTGSELGRVIKIIGLACKDGRFRFWRDDFWETAKPSWRAAHGLSVDNITWNDKLVEDVRRTLDACRVFLYFPIWNLNDGGIGSVSTNQGAAMTTAGAPNDLLSNFNPL
jgi:dipeptide/tripeptide permease